MIKGRADHWNGVGFVDIEYEDRKFEADPMIAASIVIKDLNRDPVGTQAKFKFEYEGDLISFWDRLDSSSNFKLIPTELKSDNGKRIQCRHNLNTPCHPIAIEQVCDDTVVAHHISMKDVVSHMDIKTIIVNEKFNDMFHLNKSEAYRKRVQQIRVLNILQRILLTKDPLYNTESTSTNNSIEDTKILETEANKEKESIVSDKQANQDEMNEMLEELNLGGYTIDEILEGYEEYKKSEI